MTKNFRPQPTMRDLDPHLRKLMDGARNGRATHARALFREYRMKVYTPSQIETFCAERPDLLTAESIGHTIWDERKALFEL